MDRKVESIIEEWRQLEREYAAATDDEMKGLLRGCLSSLADTLGFEMAGSFEAASTASVTPGGDA